jgi:hypothetical protein
MICLKEQIINTLYNNFSTDTKNCYNILLTFAKGIKKGKITGIKRGGFSWKDNSNRLL